MFMSNEFLVNVGYEHPIEDSLDAASEILEITKGLDGGALSAQLNILLGDVLTIVDASFQDSIQRKAVKDLVKGKFYARMDWIVRLTTEKWSDTAESDTIAGDPEAIRAMRKGTKFTVSGSK